MQILVQTFSFHPGNNNFEKCSSRKRNSVSKPGNRTPPPIRRPSRLISEQTNTLLGCRLHQLALSQLQFFPFSPLWPTLNNGRKGERERGEKGWRESVSNPVGNKSGTQLWPRKRERTLLWGKKSKRKKRTLKRHGFFALNLFMFQRLNRILGLRALEKVVTIAPDDGWTNKLDERLAFFGFHSVDEYLHEGWEVGLLSINHLFTLMRILN